MIDATPMLVFTPAVSELYNVTVTCTIHPDSTADQCVVMAMADGIMTRTGKINKIIHICTLIMHAYICTYVLCATVRSYVYAHAYIRTYKLSALSQSI